MRVRRCKCHIGKNFRVVVFSSGKYTALGLLMRPARGALLRQACFYYSYCRCNIIMQQLLMEFITNERSKYQVRVFSYSGYIQHDLNVILMQMTQCLKNHILIDTFKWWINLLKTSLKLPFREFKFSPFHNVYTHTHLPC